MEFFSHQDVESFKNKTIIFVDSLATTQSIHTTLTSKIRHLFDIFELATVSLKPKEKVLNQFREGVLTTLIVVSGEGNKGVNIKNGKIIRGLNIPNVETVINYSFPESGDDYVRKVGRCGRACTKGQALTFLIPRMISRV